MRPSLLVAPVVAGALSITGCGLLGNARERISGRQATAASCTTVDVLPADDAPGLSLPAIPARVRQIVAGSRPSDDVRSPSSVTGRAARWDVVRGGAVVASVTFFHASEARGWLLESASTCAGLALVP